MSRNRGIPGWYACPAIQIDRAAAFHHRGGRWTKTLMSPPRLGPVPAVSGASDQVVIIAAGVDRDAPRLRLGSPADPIGSVLDAEHDTSASRATRLFDRRGARDCRQPVHLAMAGIENAGRSRTPAMAPDPLPARSIRARAPSVAHAAFRSTGSSRCAAASRSIGPHLHLCQPFLPLSSGRNDGRDFIRAYQAFAASSRSMASPR